MDMCSLECCCWVLVSGEEDAIKLVDKAKKNFFNASTSTFHKLRHSGMLRAAVLIPAILVIVVVWRRSV
ncbi:unnamed protein product [Sphagnum troendelagicum]|uniref:Uncharacterized protein n=1 Tax=Sphagnum troendelagicum TaxID=128251 RepID=A0ABP0U3D2_9BRYO